MATKKNSSKTVPYLRILRIIFILCLAFLLVYIYYLHTRGILIREIKNLSTNIMLFIKENPSILISIGSYLLVFFLGFTVGRKRK